jgi:predicted homoserine dehydrogenase-like protein
MNYELLFAAAGERRIRMALTGARGGFARTLLAQCRRHPRIAVTALCDVDVDGTVALLADLGWPADGHAVCTDAAEIERATAAGRVVVVSDWRLLDRIAFDVLVEATGRPEISVAASLVALGRRIHVAMVSKETDSVVGPQLAAIARRNGVVYTAAAGDQPANLIGLVTWARVVGFEVVAAGKSSEYDYVHDPRDGTVTYCDRTVAVPGLTGLWDLGTDVAATLAARREAMAMLPQSAVPDYCEMNVVADSTGLRPASDRLSYPLARIGELADVFVPVADGGILTREGVVDVFNCLRRPDEASFGGGVFVVVRATDRETWEVLRDKGHLVSRNGRYGCIYLPHHLMGLETPATLLAAVLLGLPSGGAAPRHHAVMAMRTTRAFSAGERLAMGGHHHTVADVVPELLAIDGESRALAPFYLAADRRLVVDVPADTRITPAMLDLSGSPLAALWLDPVVD